jgi:hypothetical protein
MRAEELSFGANRDTNLVEPIFGSSPATNSVGVEDLIGLIFQGFRYLSTSIDKLPEFFYEPR